MRSTGLFSGFGLVALGLAMILPASLLDADSLRAQPGTAGVADNPDATPAELFADFLHYARMGRYRVAEVYADALLAHPDLDPVELLQVADHDKSSVDTLQIIIAHSSISEKAAKVLELLEIGQYETRKNPERIRDNIAKLGGSLQQQDIARRRLVDSGEWAVPALVATLGNRSKQNLHLPMRRTLASLGKSGVGPLTAALRVKDHFVRLAVIEALGALGYAQAVPYLRSITVDSSMPEESKAAAVAAIERIAELRGRPTYGTAEELFLKLAEQFYDEASSVKADTRLPEANVWYWDTESQTLAATPVPTKIFGSVMAMRCCEEALKLRNDYGDSIALWLAANTRREARLGLDVEDGDPSRMGEDDATRPSSFPRALYFTLAAGPRYAHKMLARAVEDGDSSVALGAIEALRVTASESSLIGGSDMREPLAAALQFPDLVVRTRAALALGAALPRSPFSGSQYVMPILSNALLLTGRESLLVVDGDEANLNRIVSELRQGDRTVIGETNVYRGLGRVRAELQSVSGIVLATDVAEPGLTVAMAQLRSEINFSKTPVVVLAKARQSLLADQTAEHDAYAEAVHGHADGGSILSALQRIEARTGQRRLDGDLAHAMAMEAAKTLLAIASDGRTVFDFTQAEPALLTALDTDDEAFQTAIAHVLALTSNTDAQMKLAALGFGDHISDSLRIVAFESLATSAKSFGNLLDEQQLSNLIDIARNEPDLTIRTAASKALGALNLASNKASEIIRSYHRG
ncbi:MAG: HEAT repeat domain-containing protein [Phycisphaerae bacterium]